MAEGTKIIIASNRVPYNITKVSGKIQYKKSVGGLVSALDPILSKNGGLWIGWDGASRHDKDFKKSIKVGDKGGKGYTLKFINLTPMEIKNYYHGFTNRSLWPLFHGFIFQSYFDVDYWKSYRAVNRKFADNILEEVKGRELVWIHDYHLTLVPERLRKESPELKLAFFLHIPFPNYEIFRVLPWGKEILKGLLGCDLIGFQTRSDSVNFLECCMKMLGLGVDFEKKWVRYKNRVVEVRGIPVSIDFKKFNKLAESKGSDRYIKSIKSLGDNAKVVISIERLDYTKGVKERLEAISRFFEKYPEYRKKVVFMQISVPSRTKIKEYEILKRETDELVGKINGRFGDELWAPINYLYQALPQSKLAALYKISDVCLLTPLRDGMNLIAKEYVSCKENETGVLILSKFAGAMEEMGEFSIAVNPYDIEEVADSIHEALSMNGSTKKKLMSQLRHIVENNNIYDWANNFINYFK